MKELTGKFYHKKTWLGLVLMVEVKEGEGPFTSCRYRKATEKDLKHLKL